MTIDQTYPIVQTALKGRAFPIFIGTSVPETMVSPIIALGLALGLSCAA